ncbi:MAG: DoxX family protein [Bacteroidetes bacterium]|nr:MAG: DoxX family protein [Bacteroidota bacterium]
MKKLLLNFSRLLTGAVFVFSGFVKGVDPLGTAYKLEDYFAAYGTEWANELSLSLSILLCVVEFTIGVALLLNLKPKLAAWGLMLVMVFFTGLTLYDAIYAPVADCGCFGDAIKLTNWQTFYKNVVLLVFTVIVFRNRNKEKKRLPQQFQSVLVVLVMILFGSFSWYNYQHEPMIDFRPWKVGNSMNGDPNAETNVYLIYRNKTTGETKEYLSPNYPWNDKSWLEAWEFVDQRFESENPGIAHNLRAEDINGADNTSLVLDSEIMFVFVSYDIEKVSGKAASKFMALSEVINSYSLSQVILTASLPEEMASFQSKHNSQLEAFFADEVVLKTMIRSNPGLVLFNKGVVIEKWHYNDFPDEKEISELKVKLEKLNQTGN